MPKMTLKRKIKKRRRCHHLKSRLRQNESQRRARHPVLASTCRRSDPESSRFKSQRHPLISPRSPRVRTLGPVPKPRHPLIPLWSKLGPHPARMSSGVARFEPMSSKPTNRLKSPRQRSLRRRATENSFVKPVVKSLPMVKPSVVT